MTSHDIYLLSPEISVALLAVAVLLLDLVITRKGYLAVIAVLGLAAPLGLSLSLWFSGLDGAVKVFRDAYGIPHVLARTAHDAFFGQGFVTAQDRLWHMDADRHKALGRWAEWVGVPGLGSDCLLRAAGMGRTAVLDYQASSPETRAMLDAYTAGVNAFIETTKTLPVEYALLDQRPEPWENWHCLTVYKMRNSLLGTFEPKPWRTCTTGRCN